MGKAREVEIQFGVSGKEYEVINPCCDNRTLSIGNLSLVHIFADEVIGFPMSIRFYRMIPMLDGCVMERCCTFYGETSDNIWLPPGDYEYDLCDMLASKYIPDGVYTLTLVIEEPPSDFILAEQLNSRC